MRKSKDIDFTKVSGMTYAVDEYLGDIPMYEVVSNYVKLFKTSDSLYVGEFELRGENHTVNVNVSDNKCYIDSEEVNAEEFVMMFEGENVDPCPTIKRITGIDLDDYISDVTYEDGTIEYLDVKGKTFFMGGFVKKEKK